MGWKFFRVTRDQLIRELTALHDTASIRREVIDHTLIGDVLWSVVRSTVKKTFVSGFAAGESVCFICCDLLECSGGEWGYRSFVEAEHPYHYSCPLHYLDMAPQRCVTWRERVRSYHARHRADGVSGKSTAW